MAESAFATVAGNPQCRYRLALWRRRDIQWIRVFGHYSSGLLSSPLKCAARLLVHAMRASLSEETTGKNGVLSSSRSCNPDAIQFLLHDALAELDDCCKRSPRPALNASPDRADMPTSMGGLNKLGYKCARLAYRMTEAATSGRAIQHGFGALVAPRKRNGQAAAAVGQEFSIGPSGRPARMCM